MISHRLQAALFRQNLTWQHSIMPEQKPQFQDNMDLKQSSLTQGVVNVSLIWIFIDAAKHLESWQVK